MDRAITDGALHSLVVAAGSPLAQYSVVSRRANGAALAAGEMSRLGDSFPNSYLVNVGLSYVKSAQNNAKEALRFAKIAVQCSPRNARTWLRLAKVYGEASQSIRQSRVAADISPDEWKSLNRLYLLSAAAALKSTQLDPTYPEGWLEVAQMACFSGDEELADQAYWKSLQLNANDHQALAWGMEMYQPKWLNNRSKLDKVVQMVVNAKYDALDVGIILADNIAKLDARYIEDSRKLKARIEKESRELVQKDPANFNGNAALAELALSENKGDESATHLLAMAKANPDNEETLRVLANAAKSKPEAAETIKLLQAELKRKPDSIKIRQALDDLVNWENKFPAAARRTASAPSNPEALQHLKLGQSLADMGKRDEAIEELKIAIKIDPKMGKAHYLLGMQLFYTNKRPEAATELQLASDLLPDDADILSNYGFVLQAIGKAKEAIAFLRRSVELNPKVFNSQQLYVFTLIYLKMAPESLAAAKDALAANDNDPMFRPMVGAAYELNNDDASALKEYQTAIKEQKVKIWQAAAHMDAGRLLWKMGQKDEARKEMQIVIDLEPRSYGMTAKQLLAQ